MFGNLSAFVNGNMFLGLFGNDLFVRLSSEDQKELLKKKGASVLEPMKGKAYERLRHIAENLEERAGTPPRMGVSISKLEQQATTEKDEK